MKVKDLIASLLKENQEADVCISPFGEFTRAISNIDRGWFLVNSPGQFVGFGVTEQFAKNCITTDNKPFLDLTSSCITKAVFLNT